MSTSAKKPEPATQSLIVYAARSGEDGDVWNADYDLLRVPENWEYLRAGDAFLTRTVKRLGPTWVLKKPDSKRRYTRTLGLYAPAENIRKAEAMSAETQEGRAKQRQRSARQRAQKEETYRAAFRQAVLEYLDFAPEHSALAEKIADGVVAHACPVGSGTVARTSMLDLKDKARLAVRPYVRHRFTDYEEQLTPMESFLSPKIDSESYREAKETANEEADEFIRAHRRERTDDE